MKPTKNNFFCLDSNKTKMRFETEKKALNFIKFNSHEIEKETGKVFKLTLTNGQGLPEVKETLNIGLMEENALINSFKKDEKSLFAVAKEVGVKDIRSVFDCYRDKETSDKIQNLLTESNKYGING